MGPHRKFLFVFLLEYFKLLLRLILNAGRRIAKSHLVTWAPEHSLSEFSELFLELLEPSSDSFDSF